MIDDTAGDNFCIDSTEGNKDLVHRRRRCLIFERKGKSARSLDSRLGTQVNLTPVPGGRPCPVGVLRPRRPSASPDATEHRERSDRTEIGRFRR